MSLRGRVLVGAAVIAAVLAIAAAAIARITERTLLAQVDAQLGAAEPFRGGRGAPGPHGGPGLPPAPGEPPERLSSLYVAVRGPGGAVITLATPNLTDPVPPLPDLRGADLRPGIPVTLGSRGSDLRYRVLARPAGPGELVVLLGLPLGDLDAAVDRLVRLQGTATLVALAVLAVVAGWVIRLGVRPLRRMTATAQAIGAGDLGARVPEEEPGTEAGDLGAALNAMLGRIEEAFAERTRSEERLRRFVGDASHELRTPITTVRGYAELYRSGGLEDPAELREAMRRTEQEATRMGALIDDLLHLARLDQGRPLLRQPVDLAALADDAARDARAVAPDRVVSAEVERPATVSGDEGRLRQVLGNLVGNALVHTPPGTPVEVRVRGQGGCVVLEVTDHGDGMDAETAHRAFERFYRADPARARNRGGSGLGLSIVRATVQAHGGTVALRSAPGAGTTVRVELPRQGDS